MKEKGHFVPFQSIRLKRLKLKRVRQHRLTNYNSNVPNKPQKELQKIPYGKTKSYSEIAKAIGNKNAQRAVGSACNKNPIMIIIPCHRVISKNNNLGGYAYGRKIKQKLLDNN